jgi:hypothetical protein
VHPHHAQPDRSDEEDRPEPAASSASDPQLVPARGTISSGVVEGFNGKVKLTTRKAFGFRTAQGIEIALFHVLARLPEPKFTNRFC